MDRCEKCGGQLYADRTAMHEISVYGYVGGRVHCLMGCTSVWLVDRAPGAYVAPPSTKERAEVAKCCIGCKDWFWTSSSAAKRCTSCREKVLRYRHKLAQRRYSAAHA